LLVWLSSTQMPPTFVSLCGCDSRSPSR
jgi:hypothetical protein